MLRTSTDETQDEMQPLSLGDIRDSIHHDSPNLYLDDAWIVLNMLRWQHLQSLYPVNQPIAISAASPPTNSTSSFSKPLTNLLSSAISLFSSQSKTESEIKKPLLTAMTEDFYIHGSQQALKMSIEARKMIKLYCQDDNPDNPSVLFDAIVVGAYVLIMAIEDKKYRKQKQYQNKDLYPITLDALVDMCKINPDYANTTIIGIDDSLVGNIMFRRLIWTIGYKCLFEKSLPFDGVIRNDFAPALAPHLPPSRFQRYNLNPKIYTKYTQRDNSHSNPIRMIAFNQLSFSPEKNCYCDMDYNLDTLHKIAAIPQPIINEFIKESTSWCPNRTFACQSIDETTLMAIAAAAVMMPPVDSAADSPTTLSSSPPSMRK